MNYPFYDLKTFEQSIIKYDTNKPDFYILSDKYRDYYGFGLSRLSIFDNEERGTIKQDKEKINKLLEILMETDNSDDRLSKIKELDICEVEKKGIGSMLGMAIGDAMGARYEFEDFRYDTIILINMGEGLGGKFGSTWVMDI